MEFFTDPHMWLFYFGLIIAPFVQEDSAVIWAASLSVTQSQHWIPIFIAISIGLIASDSWKYWLGWAAKHHKWAKKYANHARTLKLKKAIVENSVRTLVGVRFIPFARIPTYLAAGFFGVPYIKYWLSISFSAILFISLIFAGFHMLGEVMGESVKTYMPRVSLIIIVIIVSTLVVKRLTENKQ
ncbi:MAG: hypothetical protein COA43_03510 [Robiginitomaculum sp.]|nr:MAG: hypothetical protein COA43_03510 [Robiginitomaculum sp.]